MKYFLKDMLERAIKTLLQALAASGGAALLFDEIPWLMAIVLPIVCALLSMFTSLCCRCLTGKDNASLISEGKR